MIIMKYLKFGILRGLHSLVGKAQRFLDVVQLVECKFWEFVVAGSCPAIQTLLEINAGSVSSSLTGVTT